MLCFNTFFTRKVRRQKKRKTHMTFPKELMETAAESEAFIYPSLLPSAPFRTTFNMAGPNSFTHSEDMYVLNLLLIINEGLGKLETF